MSTPIHGDSSAADWYAQTLASIESYSSEQADAAAEAYWQQQNNQQTTVTTGSYQTDGVDLPTTNQRALDAFLGPASAQGGTAIGGAPGTDGPGTSGRTYLDPADAEQHRQSGFTVMTDDNGHAYLPPQGGYDVSLQAPPLTVLPGVGHSGPPTAPPAAAKPDQSPTGRQCAHEHGRRQSCR